MAQEIYIRRQPAAMVQFPQIIRRLVVPPDDDRQYRGHLFPRVVLVKPTQLFVLGGHSHRLQVLMVPYRLEVPAYEQQIDFRLQLLDMLIYFVKFAMAAPFDGDLHR